MDYIHVDYDELMDNKKCPFCGWKNDIDYTGQHTVVYQCECCGFSTKFINPKDGFAEWELDDYPEGDDAAFMDAVEKAQKDDLESSSVEHFVPQAIVKDGVAVLAAFSRVNDRCKDFVGDCVSFEKEETKTWRNGKQSAVKYLVKALFTEAF